MNTATMSRTTTTAQRPVSPAAELEQQIVGLAIFAQECILISYPYVYMIVFKDVRSILVPE